MTRFLALLALATPGTAHAFCGTYVGQAGASLYNNASQMVVVRQGNLEVALGRRIASGVEVTARDA